MTSNKVYVAMNEAHDECYTRLSDALDMFRFVMQHVNLKNKVVWLPFNDDGRNIEKAAHSLKIYKTESGGRFPDNEPPCWDIMISNPPFSGRTKLFKQIFSYDKPFVLLQPVQMFNNSSFVQMICDRNDDIGIACPKRRTSFIVGDKEYDNSGTAFYSMWLCYKIPTIRGFTTLGA